MSTLRILLLGRSGQVGWELQRALAPLGELIALDRRDGTRNGQPTPPDLSGDLESLNALSYTIQTLKPHVIVNAAAYTAVDKAESDAAAAEAINATAPGLIAKEAAALGAWLVHYSTDYVFDGSGDLPRDEEAPTGPLNVYGKSKLDGEALIAASGCRHLIFRTSWVYGARGGNFAKTMLRLAGERDKLQVIDDQIGAPTGADLIADVTALTLRTLLVMDEEEEAAEYSGIYNLVAAGETSWHGYASHVIAKARAAGHAIKVADADIAAVPSSAFATAAKRPLNSRLATGKLRQRFHLHLPDWKLGVDRMLAELPAPPASTHSTTARP